MSTLFRSQTKISNYFERASKDGEVQIKHRNGQSFVIKPIKTKKFHLDVQGVSLNLSSKDIVDIVREQRERN